MQPLFVKAILLGVMPEEACFDNGYPSPWSYALLRLMGVKPRIGFRKNAKLGWRGKSRILSLHFRKIVNAGRLNPDWLQALDFDPDFQGLDN